MKSFVIFPTICVFVLTLTLLTISGQPKWRTVLWSTLGTAIFGGLMIWQSVEVFEFLYFSNFLGALVCVPCLTYLTNRLFKNNSSKRTFWIRVLGLGIISTVVTLVTAGFLIMFSLINNPMDPPTNGGQTEKRGD